MSLHLSSALSFRQIYQALVGLMRLSPGKGVAVTHAYFYAKAMHPSFVPADAPQKPSEHNGLSPEEEKWHLGILPKSISAYSKLNFGAARDLEAHLNINQFDAWVLMLLQRC